ncbi:tRNA (guanine(37)-N(1))-methyltransferase [Diutina catenulata]
MKFTTRYLFHYLNKTNRRTLMETKFGPPVNRSMVELDRDFFKKHINLFVAYFPKPQFLGTFVKECKADILNIPSVKHIVDIDGGKGVLLRSDIIEPSQDISEETHTRLKEYEAEVRPYAMELDYTFWKTDDILRAVLPEELLDDVPSGYAQAGHVAHLNLRDEFKPYGKLIGQVILDKNNKIQTVVDKINTIDTKFRTFPMQLLAGKDDLFVEQSESGCRFKFDFSKVYWNSRLSTEHDRLVSEFKPGEMVADVFAGVGPFAVPAGKKQVLCLANDLNPESYRYLVDNIKLNKCDDFVKPFNMDGRSFIRQSPSLLSSWYSQQPCIDTKKVVKRRKVDEQGVERSVRENEMATLAVPRHFSHYVMNLPDSALTFLDAFIGLFNNFESSEKSTFKEMPMIHVHCFEKYSNDEAPEPSLEEIQHRVHKRIQTILAYPLEYELCSFHLVRKVAPTKPMFCVSFRLPEEVAFKKV